MIYYISIYSFYTVTFFSFLSWTHQLGLLKSLRDFSKQRHPDKPGLKGSRRAIATASVGDRFQSVVFQNLALDVQIADLGLEN
ncbi:hypothetical protein [Microcoleus sp. bin38.metabat.b11b12b14.051]|uniref:hypothetical protein n=1 Tax=Microcoleus sp. bin38.metabat.b11b12b14.051 TaxID=2742709 RepID=UPI0025F990A8|nr:hypothetical protein [Microcoleus sp. bin38.metabat.b11b12b14.051]